ncbi:response regulator [Candidatus Pacebacteria bacterium]|nr:response regulator [Candidatus Paceibacterota bacterium]
MKLLLVDDDAFLRDMYAIKFEEAGHTVFVAKQSAEAISLLEGGEVFDVILMDMVMPGITGVELLEKIKKLDLARNTKCIVLSNQGEQSDIDSATSAGAVGYIIKAESIPSQVVSRVEELAK